MHASSPTGFCQQHQHTVSALARASRHNVESWDTGSQPQPLNAGACSTNTSDIRSSWPPPSTSLLLQAGKLQPHAAMQPPSLTQLSTTFARHTTMIEKQSVSGHWPENILQVYHYYTILKNCKCNVLNCESFIHIIIDQTYRKKITVYPQASSAESAYPNINYVNTQHLNLHYCFMGKQILSHLQTLFMYYVMQYQLCLTP